MGCINRLLVKISPDESAYSDQKKLDAEWCGIVMAYYLDFIPGITKYAPVGGWRNPIESKDFLGAYMGKMAPSTKIGMSFVSSRSGVQPRASLFNI